MISKSHFKITTLLSLLVFTFGFHSNAQQIILSDEGLSDQEKSIVKIASHTAQGNLVQLMDVLNEGLNNDLTINETKEVLVHLYAYAGFPRSIRGLQTLLKVLKERKSKGIEDDWGPEASSISDSETKYERGKTILEELVGRPLEEKPEYQKFSPEIDRFLKEHLFADVFERDVLSYKQRELVTISVIASLGALEPMLRSHYNLSLNVGWQPEQLESFTRLIETTAGKEKAESALSVLGQILENRE